MYLLDANLQKYSQNKKTHSEFLYVSMWHIIVIPSLGCLKLKDLLVYFLGYQWMFSNFGELFHYFFLQLVVNNDVRSSVLSLLQHRALRQWEGEVVNWLVTISCPLLSSPPPPQGQVLSVLLPLMRSSPIRSGQPQSSLIYFSTFLGTFHYTHFMGGSWSGWLGSGCIRRLRVQRGCSIA